MLTGKYVNKYYLKYIAFFLIGLIALLAVNYYQLEIPGICGDIIDGIENKTLLDNHDLILSFMYRLAFIAFMDDLGITRTYANIENNQALKQDAYYLDRSIRDPFTLEYLVSYYQYNYAESLESLISNIYYEEEKFD